MIKKYEIKIQSSILVFYASKTTLTAKYKSGHRYIKCKMWKFLFIISKSSNTKNCVSIIKWKKSAFVKKH